MTSLARKVKVKTLTNIVAVTRTITVSPHHRCSKALSVCCCRTCCTLSISSTSFFSCSSTGSLTSSNPRRPSRRVRHSTLTSRGTAVAARACSVCSLLCPNTQQHSGSRQSHPGGEVLQKLESVYSKRFTYHILSDIIRTHTYTGRKAVNYIFWS